jgi:hypothetical protein
MFIDGRGSRRIAAISRQSDESVTAIDVVEL